MTDLLDRKLIFVTGKGGVGKTTIAASLALLASGRGRKTPLREVDASASGHIVSQLAAPQAINELVQVGAVRQQTGWMLDILGDPATTGLVIVATPEEMPVNETVELSARVEKETNVDLAAIVVNR